MVIIPHTQEIVPKKKISKRLIFLWSQTTSWRTCYRSIKNAYANVTKPHQWTNSIQNPNIFTSEEEWLTHTIDSLLKRLHEIKNQKSNQNKAPCTSSASQSNEITLTVSTQFTTEQRNESTVLNSMSALPPTIQLVEFVASVDENEMENITASTKRCHHDSSDEEPNSPATKKPASGSPASGQDGTPVLTGTGKGDLPKISTFCPDLPRSGGQGSSGGERSPIRPPDYEKLKAQLKPSKQSKSNITKAHLKIMAHNYIIQWNCRGLRSNIEDIELLISKYSPAAICLQETLPKPDQIQTFKHYSAYYKSGFHRHGGVCILVKNNFIHSQVQFQADLQAVAVCVTINNKTYCSLCICSSQWNSQWIGIW